MSDTPADAAGRTPRNHRSRGPAPVLDTERDVLMPDLRERARKEGRDPDEVDPMSLDEDAGRRDGLGGSTGLD